MLLAAALVLALSPVRAQDIVLRQSGAGEVRFIGRSFGLPIVSGRFEHIDCAVSVDLLKPEGSKIAVGIATGSLRSLIGVADGLVKGPLLLDSERHPQMSFVSRSVRRISDGHFRIDGLLTVKGITRPISLQAVIEGDLARAGTGQAFPFTATTSISRAAFDIGRDITLIDDRLEISVSGQLS
ncbi:YceI family protein [Bosea sp. (in: a-proteobacteria)]|uniref:YceI family protein n=1 Tax=Bosea sp. (in: a-proteobacteria) TaxID=1871050 RepID=UPI003B3A828B